LFAHKLPEANHTVKEGFEFKLQSSIVLAQAILQIGHEDTPNGNTCLLQHKKTLLARIYSFVTDANGKYSYPYRSCGVLKAIDEGLNDVVVEHEHVFSRSHLSETLIEKPSSIESVFREKLVTCIVTQEEHRRLGEQERNNGVLGWERYKSAGVVVPGIPETECRSA